MHGIILLVISIALVLHSFYRMSYIVRLDNRVINRREFVRHYDKALVIFIILQVLLAFIGIIPNISSKFLFFLGISTSLYDLYCFFNKTLFATFPNVKHRKNAIELREFVQIAVWSVSIGWVCYLLNSEGTRILDQQKLNWI